MSTYDKILSLANQKGITIYALEKNLNLTKNNITKWKDEKINPSAAALTKIADYFNVSVDYLLDRAMPDSLYTDDIVTFPILAGVAAGFGKGASEIETGEFVQVPRSVMRGYNKDELLVFQVQGDSMLPELKDGDKVLVVRQTSVTSGSVAVICYDDYENGTIKKVQYEPNCDYVDLIPFNPKYDPVRIKGSALEGVRVIGKVIYLFRELNF